MILQFWKSKNRSLSTKVKVLVGLFFFLKALGENHFHCHFHFLEAACMPWLWDPFQLAILSL